MFAVSENTMVLKVEDKSFKDSGGKEVKYVSCNLLGEDGEVFENVTVATEVQAEVLDLEDRSIVTATIEIFKKSSKEGKKYLAMRLSGVQL